MKLGIWIVAGIIVVAIVATWYTSKHYSLNKLSASTGVAKETLVEAAK